jgi:hypothetical protein
VSPITGALPITLYWVAVLLLAAGCLVTIGIAHWRKKNTIIAIAAALLAVDLVLVAIPSPESPVGVSVALGVLAVAIAVLGGGTASNYVLKLSTRGLVRPGLFGGIIVTEPERLGNSLLGNAGEQHEVLRGGRTIGYLERFAIAGTLIAGYPEAVAVIIAIKGVGRFTELAAAEARERFIIGTLTSIIWAASSAALFHFAML